MSLKSKIFPTILFLSIIIAGSDSGKDEKVDGKYIMHHIQDDRVFEIFNPLDWDDANQDHYYFTSKIKLGFL